MPMTLRWQQATSLAVEAECLRPETMSGLSAVEAARLPVRVGNATAEVGDLFRVEGDRGAMAGWCSRAISRMSGGSGRGWASGIADDPGGRRVASRGGDDRRHDRGRGEGRRLGGRRDAGRDDRDPRGRAATAWARPIRGAGMGMRDGLILVEGMSADDAGLAMRRGLIAVSGTVGRRPGPRR